MKIDISIIIVNYNVQEYIISCIESIYKHSTEKIKFEIIVIDNDSFDDSVNQISSIFPDVRLIKNNLNIGFSKAVNQGAVKAKGNHILILNPDTLFIENSLKKFLKALKASKNIGAIGSLLLDENGYTQQSCWKDPSLINTILSLFHLDFLNFKKNYNIGELSKFTEVDTLSGAVIFIRRNLFLDLGGFNENLFWMEDIDLCVRLRNYGLKNYLLPGNRIVHFAGKSASKNYEFSISNQILSKLKYFKIHSSLSIIIFLYLAIIINILLKLMFLCFLTPFSNTYRKKFYAYVKTFFLVMRFNLK